MAVVKKTKASDLHTLCKRLLSLWKKQYHLEPLSKKERPVLEVMLFAICLENSTQAQADQAIERLTSTFQDFNEVRVSTYFELTPIFEGLSEPEARAARVRAVLQYVFEINFDFDFESLGRKTLDIAEKQLQKIRFLSSFIQSYTLHAALGTHTIPIDDCQRDAAVFLGLATPDEIPEEVANGLKSALPKAEISTFCQYLRAFATDPRLLPFFAKHKAPEEGHDLDDTLVRTKEFIANAIKAARASKSKAKAKLAHSGRDVKKPAAKSTAKAGKKKTP